jgi:hypothetical protein
VNLLKVFEYVAVAAEAKSLPGGRYFRLMKASAEVDVEFFADDGSSLGKAEGVLAGFAVSFQPREIGRESSLISFASCKITSATAQTIQAAISRQRVEYDRLSGSIDAEIIPGTTFNSVADVALAAAATTLILAANADRKEAIISNLLANASTMRIGDAGAAAANGIPLAPGETIVLTTSGEIRGFNPGAIQSVAVSDIAA